MTTIAARWKIANSMKTIFQNLDLLSNGLTKDRFVTSSNAALFSDTHSPEALLNYFQERRCIRYFALKPGQAKHVASAERILNNEFDLNNERHILAADFDWLANPSRDLEWLILLHKFYYSRDLALAYQHSGDERYAKKWVELVESWILRVPDGFVDSQVTGRRLQQWLLAYHYFVPGLRCQAVSADFLKKLLKSMQSQAVFLSNHLTSEGNHRTIELYAIFSVAVLFPELPESDKLMTFAKHELLNNLRADFLPDGVQKELSTDYHHTVLKNFLRVRELADLNGVVFTAEFDQLLGKSLDFSVYAHKPDGFLPAINDGDVNSYLSLMRKAHRYYPSEQLLYAASRGQAGQPPRQRSRIFPDSGYCVLRSDWAQQPYQDGRYLFFDCANLGFGSHGHYDLLSFEAAAFGRSLIVDPGRYTYHEDHGDQINWRHVFKGTAAHNTVMMNGQDQISYRCREPI
ncbi:MAG: alginate lyase family protein, partial [Methylococcales bacterium]